MFPFFIFKEESDDDSNCYLIKDKTSYVLIDAGHNARDIINFLDEKCGDRTAFSILLTHGHYDHIYGIPEIVEKFPDTIIYISADDLPLLTDPQLNESKTKSCIGIINLDKYQSNFHIIPSPLSPLNNSDSFDFWETYNLDYLNNKGNNNLKQNKRFLINKDNVHFKVGENIQFKILKTPGHTDGSLSFVCEEKKCVFSGDCLFYESMGITDAPTSDPTAMDKSLNEVLMSLADDYCVYPGHDNETSIDHERNYNPFIYH